MSKSHHEAELMHVGEIKKMDMKYDDLQSDMEGVKKKAKKDLEKQEATSKAATSTYEAQLAHIKQKAEKREKILESNLKNAEAEVDELDLTISNVYDTLRAYPKVLEQNMSLQLMFNGLEKNQSEKEL